MSGNGFLNIIVVVIQETHSSFFYIYIFFYNSYLEETNANRAGMSQFFILSNDHSSYYDLLDEEKKTLYCVVLYSIYCKNRFKHVDTIQSLCLE